MKIGNLIDKLVDIGELEVVGVMLTTKKGEDYKQVDYFYNPLNDYTDGLLYKDYIKNLGDTVAFSTYELEYGTMASGRTVFVADYNEISFTYLLSDEVINVVFYQPVAVTGKTYKRKKSL